MRSLIIMLSIMMIMVGAEAFSQADAEDDVRRLPDSRETRVKIAPNRARLKYNAVEKTWEVAPEDAVLRYNPLSRKYELAPPDSSLKYNRLEKKWEYGTDDSRLRFNSQLRQWQLAPPDADVVEGSEGKIEPTNPRR